MTKDNIYYVKCIDNIKKVIEELNKFNSNEDFINNKNKIEMYIYDSLSAIGLLYVRLDKNIQNNENIVNAFQYLNNQIKHIHELEILTYSVAGSEYSRFYPRCYGKAHYSWLDFENHEKRKSPLRPQYEKFLMNREVKTTYYELLDYLKNIAD